MEDKSEPNPPGQSEDMYKWVVLAASFFTMFTTGSSSYASGIFHVALQETFPEAPVTLLVWAGSLFLCMYGPGAFIASALVNEFSCRTCVFLSGILGLVGFGLSFFLQDTSWLLFTYGILPGTSIGMATVGSMVVLGFYFKDNVHIVCSVALTGQGLGMFGHPPLSQYLIDEYGVRGSFLLYGGIAANSCVLGMLMKPSKLVRSTQKIIKSGRNRRNFVCKVLFGQFSNCNKIMRNGSFLFIFLGYISFGMSVATSYLCLPEFFQIYGESKQGTSYALALSGISSIISRVVTGILSRDQKVGTGLVFTGINGIIGIITLFITAFTGSTVKMMVYGFLLGLYTGGCWALNSPFCFEILRLELSASGVGFLLLGGGLGFFAGPPISNLVFDVTGNYQHVFIFSGTSFLAASFCGVMSTLARDNNSPREMFDVSSSINQQDSSSENRHRNILKTDILIATADEKMIFDA